MPLVPPAVITAPNTCTPPQNVFDIKLRRAVYPSNMAPIGAKLCQNAVQTIPVKSIFRRKKKIDEFCLGVGQHFLLLRASFGGRTGKRVSKSNPSHFFASNAPIMRSVRPKVDENMSVSAARTMGGVQVLRGTSTWLRD